MFDVVAGSLVAESHALRVVFDRDGAIVDVENLLTGQHLVAGADGRRPWRLLPQGTTSSVRVPWSADSGFAPEEITPVRFSIDDEGAGLRLRWETDMPGVAVEVTLVFATDGSLEMRPSVTVAHDAAPPAHLYFPLIDPIPLAADHGDDVLVFPAHSGWLIRRPLDVGVTEAPYPDGYQGCSVQMLAYYTEGIGGFYLSCHDPHVTHKQLRFGSGAMTIRHDAWDLRRGAAFDLDYPVVLAPLSTGDWYEAADRYRAWALTAPWAGAGKNVDRVGASRPRWLFEDVTVATWGGSTSLDWSDRYRRLGDALGSPMHHVTAWDWPARRPHNVGKEGWFPARFHPANLAAWQGHHVTPYLNDIFVSVHAPDFFEVWEPNLVYPYVTFSFQLFSEPVVGWVDGEGPTPDPKVVADIDFFVCPCTELQSELHAWRDARLVADHGVDGVFYDISSGNPHAARCLRAEHGHTPGWSRGVLQGYADSNGRSRAAMHEALGRVPAQGVETIVEHVIADIDFFAARSVMGPLGTLEAWTLGPEEPPGHGRQLVPLFQAIYHDVGPIHEDVGLTLAQSQGEIFYWVAARLVLQWGGLVCLRVNFPTDRLGDEDAVEIVAFDGARHLFADPPSTDPDRIAFLRELAAARTGFGNRHLAYGRLIRPLTLDVPSVDMDYHARLHIYSALVKQGTWSVPQVVHGAWAAPGEGSIGLFFCNLGEEPVTTDASVDTRRSWAIDWPAVTVTATTVAGAIAPARRQENDAPWRLAVELAPRRVTLVEIRPADGDGSPA